MVINHRPLNAALTSEVKDRMLRETVAKTALRRQGRPEEQAEMVLWLCSDRASFVTGAHFAADAGATA